MADTSKVEDEDQKMLGALVDKDLYWDFKKAVSNRKENMASAIAHAARLYIDVDSQEAPLNV